ncbi:unnamed protein product [Dovyalis caffra]|uniref:RWD domain-containing protein n=1 Tax=Dovyalis caffra TaxID=77055 RepID=A0AAV1SUC4_9ROSI|nr:unnamed protein product [Dovyalis caffra]
MTEHVQEQEMEIEALEAILMDEFKEIHSSESGLNTSNRCFEITISPQDDDADESTVLPVQLGLVFSHAEKYPDEPPLLNVKSIRGIQSGDLKILKEKLEQENVVKLWRYNTYDGAASDNLMCLEKPRNVNALSSCCVTGDADGEIQEKNPQKLIKKIKN